MKDSSAVRKDLFNDASEKFQETALRISNLAAAGLLWARHLTPRDQQRLGGDIGRAYAEGGTTGMYMRVRGCTRERAVLEIAKTINLLADGDYAWLMQEYGESLTGEEAFEDAIGRNALVLNDHTRQVFWKGDAVMVNWTHEAKWTFIWELARHAKKGLPIDSMTFCENANRDQKVVAKRKNRLGKEEGFPSELKDLIKVVGQGTQKLQVPPDQIRIFERHLNGEIREWFP